MLYNQHCYSPVSETLIYTVSELPQVFPVNNLHHSPPPTQKKKKRAYYQATHANRKRTYFPSSMPLVKYWYLNL